MPMTSSDEHRKIVNMSLIVGAIVVVFGMLYWWASINQPLKLTTVNTSEDLRAQVASILRSAPVQVTQNQINAVVAQLSASKTSTVAAAERQAVAASLRGN